MERLPFPSSGLVPIGITSPKGLSSSGLRKPPVFHFLKFSWTVPSSGFRSVIQGSHLERGMTETPLNSSWAPFGRSPPLNVVTSRMISPRFSRPALVTAELTMCVRSGFDAMRTLAPGLSFGIRYLVHVKKKSYSFWSWVSVKVVNLGTGLLWLPSYVGGSRQTPPRPALNLLCSFSVYSSNP